MTSEVREQITKATTRPWVARCDDRNCRLPATNEVLDCYGKTQGRFCAKHARERVESLDSYEAGRRRAIQP